jgi:hypothetical protein
MVRRLKYSHESRDVSFHKLDESNAGAAGFVATQSCRWPHLGHWRDTEPQKAGEQGEPGNR